MQAARGRDGLVARPEFVADAVYLDGQSPFEHLEALAVAEVVVRGDLPARRDLELCERPLAAGVLARLEEGGRVALDRVVDPPRAVADCRSLESERAMNWAMRHTETGRAVQCAGAARDWRGASVVLDSMG